MRFPLLPALIVILGLLALAVWIAWRLVSRRRALPCPSWLSWLVDNPLARRRTLATLDRLKLAPGLSVLDAGCGPGRLAVPIARAVGPEGRVLAVDLQPKMLERAKGKAATARAGNVEFMLAGLGQGKVPAGRFDRALLSWVLGEIPDRISALREIHAALRPGGFLLVSEVLPDPHYQSLAKVKALAQECGFRVGAYYGSRFEYAIVLKRELGTDC